MADDGSLKAGLKVLAEPVEDYFQTLGRTVSPETLTDSVTSGRMTPATLVRFMLGSAVLGSVIDAVLPTAGPLPFPDIPVLSELLVLFLWLAVGAAVAGLIHQPMVWLGARARFRHAVMLAMFNSAMFYPFVSLADAVYFRLTGDAWPPAANGFAIGWLAQSLARLYRTTYARTIGLIVGTQVLVAVPLFTVLIGNGDWLLGPTHTAETLTPALRQSILEQWAQKPELKGAAIDTLSITPTDAEGTYRGRVDMTMGDEKATLDVEVVVVGDGFRWTLTPQEK
jgi:hypothetical protein